MNKTRIHIIAALAAGLLLGAAAGRWSAFRFGCPTMGPSETSRSWKDKRPGALYDRKFERFRERLALTDEQTELIRGIFDEKRAAFDALHEEMRPRFLRMRQATMEEIRPHLSPEQQVLLDEMEARFERRRLRARDGDGSRSGSWCPATRRRIPARE